MRSLVISFLFSTLFAGSGYNPGPATLYATYSAASGAALDTGSFATENARSIIAQITNSGTATTGTISFIINLSSGESYVVATATVATLKTLFVSWGSSVGSAGNSSPATNVLLGCISGGLPQNIEIKIAAATNATPSITVYGSSR
jgi:hypothetical protein